MKQSYKKDYLESSYLYKKKLEFHTFLENKAESAGQFSHHLGMGGYRSYSE